MDARQSADDGEVLHMDVAGQIGRIGHDDVIPQLAVVGDMAVGHQQVVIADEGDADVGCGRPVDRDILPDRVVVADDDPRRLPPVFQVLRGAAEGGELGDAASLADVGVALDDHMGADDRVFPDMAIGTDDAVRSDLDPFGKRRVRGDDRCGVDIHKGSFSFFSSSAVIRR